jgi:hypothetical protein
MIPQYSMVSLTTDRFRDEGATLGMVGAVLEVFGDGAAYLVDFSNPDTGETLAMITAKEEDLALVPWTSAYDD